MFNNVIVGVDDMGPGRDALALAERLVARDGTLTLVNVRLRVLGAAPGSETVGEAATRRRALERLAALRDEAHVDARVSAVQARSVAAGLHDAVADEGDLLVIGATRRDDYERMYIGDDTRDVLESPPRPVAVAPAGYARRAGPIATIGVAYDGTPAGDRALAVARELALRHGAELSAFEAVREPIRVRDPLYPEAEIERLVEQARHRVALLGDVEADAGAGDPADALAKYARSVDLVVLGAHEPRPLDRLGDGTTAQRLARLSPAPLLVLAPAAST